MPEMMLSKNGLFSIQFRALSDTPFRFIKSLIESLIRFGSLQVLATVRRSRMPFPSVSSFFILLSDLERVNISIGPGVLPFAKDCETFPRFLMEDPVRCSILATALVARGVIHSAEQTSAGSGVDAHPLAMANAGMRMRERSMRFMPEA